MEVSENADDQGHDRLDAQGDQQAVGGVLEGAGGVAVGEVALLEPAVVALQGQGSGDHHRDTRRRRQGKGRPEPSRV